MTRIRYLLQAFRARRNRQLSRTESVSFEAFCNEAVPRYPNSPTKESSLNGDFSISPINKPRNVSILRSGYNKLLPINLIFLKGDEYVRFSSNQNYDSNKCPRPSLPAVLLAIMLLAVFLILPLIYLLHCFGIIYTREHFGHPTVQEQVSCCISIYLFFIYSGGVGFLVEKMISFIDLFIFHYYSFSVLLNCFQITFNH